MASRTAGRGIPLLIVLALFAVLPASASAQADFLFERPSATVSVFAGWAMPGERSDLFDFTRDELTVSEGDFAAPAGLLELAFRVNERLDLGVGIDYASSTVDSEMRDWVTMDDRPIPQSTLFRRARLLANVKGYLLPRGRQISEYAWVPHRWSPYVGIGGGLSMFEFTQSGDFVDYQTYDIFETELTEKGNAWTALGLAGVQVSLSPRLLLRGEYRYIWAEGALRDGDFRDFGDLDLSGSRALLGLAVRM
ncbi:MAG: outer membrane protein [Gemmatimonadota bacterium]